MASPHVRQWFMDKITQLAPAAPFQETDGILVNQKNLPEMWATLEFDVGSNQRLSVGKQYLEREYGTASVLFLMKAGRGPFEVMRIAQQFADRCKEIYQEEVYEELTGIKGTARFENVGPPNSEPYEDGNWLVCSLAIVYSYDSVRGYTLPPDTPIDIPA
jgi:hypothetical protein